MRKVESINESSLAYPFSLIFKNMGFETIVQIYHVNRLDFAHLFYRNGIRACRQLFIVSHRIFSVKIMCR